MLNLFYVDSLEYIIILFVWINFIGCFVCFRMRLGGCVFIRGINEVSLGFCGEL